MKVNERTERSALHFSAARGRRDFCARHEMWVGTSSARTSDEISSQGCPGRGERHLGSSPAGPGDSTRPRATMSGALPIAYDYRDFSLRPEVPAPDSLRGRESLSTSQGKAGIPLAESLPLFEGSVAWPWPRWEFVARARARAEISAASLLSLVDGRTDPGWLRLPRGPAHRSPDRVRDAELE
jgi:hypothetical protein